MHVIFYPPSVFVMQDHKCISVIESVLRQGPHRAIRVLFIPHAVECMGTGHLAFGKCLSIDLPGMRIIVLIKDSVFIDVGSGRGVFLIPFIKEFPWVKVISLDLLEKRVTFLNELAEGGYGQLYAEQKDICQQPFPDRSFDVVTLLEVLEHIPEVKKVVAAAVRMAKQYVVVTVPSKPDNNPEHIHLLTKARLTEMFGAAGCTRLHFDGVEGHLFLVAAVGDCP